MLLRTTTGSIDASRSGIGPCLAAVSSWLDSMSFNRLRGTIAVLATIGERDEVVLPEPLENKERGRGLPSIGDQMRTSRADCIGLAWHEPDVFLGIAEKEPNLPHEYIFQ